MKMKQKLFLVILAFTLTLAAGVSHAKAAENTDPENKAENAVKIEIREVDLGSDILADGILAMGEDETADGLIAGTEEDIKEPEITEEKEEKQTKDTKNDKAKSEKTKSEKAKSDKAAAKTAAKTAAAKAPAYTAAEVKLLSCLIYAEAGNQSYKGKLAVGNVVMNRVKSNLFPNTLTGVIYQKGYSSSYGRYIYQFSVASPTVATLSKALNIYGKRTNKAEIAMEKECIKAAKAALEGQKAFQTNYLFFSRYSNSLASRNPGGVKLEAHYFYK